MYTFTKEERLCNKKLIDGLFHNGSSFLCYPFKVLWLLNAGQQVCAQVLVSVSKRKFKHATDRNLIKRRTREAYRLNKHQLLYEILNGADKKIVFSLNYVGKVIEPYEVIEKKMQKLLIQLCEEIVK